MATLRISLFIGVLPLFVACGNTEVRDSGGSDGAGAKNDSVALKVGVRQTLDCLPALVARDEGIFDSLGVDVRLVHFTSQLECDASLLKKEIHGAFMDERNVDYLRQSNRYYMEIVANTDLQWTLVANRKSRLHKVGQLKDKLVAMTRNSATDQLCDRLVDSARLVNEKVFRIQVNDVDVRLKMLLGDEVDAAWLPEPQSAVALAKGCNTLMSSGRGGERLAVIAFSHGVSDDKVGHRRIALFLQGYRLAESMIEKRGAAYKANLIKHYYNY